MEILIPTIEKYKAFKLTKNFEIEEFESFLKNNGYGAIYSYKDEACISIMFKWNPYGYDYDSSITLELGQIFMYNEDNPEECRIVNKLEDSWIINS